MEITGKIKYQNIATGTWSLIGDNGVTYELKNPPSEITKDGITVKITGKIREDIMTIAMIGPVLEIDSYSVS